ncbi:F-box protein [Trifolium medium]|uniref:F-box protein n=1 Tax=Trifolium medium TaxID=97028 RepID=A0A392P4G9_9FABA|nr:F-box protein [Trifolium medium]
MEVIRFLTAILAGDFKLLMHLDISNREGLACEADWYHRCYSSSYAETFDAEMNSDISLQFSSPTSDGSIFMSTSESSYNSDHGSGNEEGQDAVIYGESSDEDNNMNL